MRQFSSENRPNETIFSRPARELESFDRSGACGEEETNLDHRAGDGDDDHNRGQAAGSSSCEVSDAEEQHAPPRQPEGATCEEDYDIAVSDTPCTESISGSGPEEHEPRAASEGTDGEDDQVVPCKRHNL